MKNRRKVRLFKVKYTNYFEARKYILNYTEDNFYKELFEVAQRTNMILLAKVSIYDLVSIKNTPYRRFALKQCGTESIDFLFVEKESSKIVLSVRLDDPYNKSKRRFKTERFINELFAELNMELVRIKITEDYNYLYLENRLKELISKSEYAK